MRKFKIGDCVISIGGKPFIITHIDNCGYSPNDCSDNWGKLKGCPGHINGICFGTTHFFRLKLNAKENPNSNIMVKL